MKYLVGIIICFIVAIGAYWIPEPYDEEIWENRKVSDVLTQLGEERFNVEDLSGTKGSAKVGEQIVKYGKTLTGRKIKKQSKHFECTACHNLVKEDPVLETPNPEDRLQYAVDNELPFLQGSTLYGVVNRTTYYNGDYDKKYGALVDKARTDLREAIQLCAVECAQGRRLQRWEMESVVAYLNTIDLKIKDLGLSSIESKQVEQAVKGKQLSERVSAVKILKSKYSQASPANFIDPPEDRNTPMKGNAFRGKLVYEKACMHCHEDGKYSFYKLDYSDLTFQYLKKQFPKYNRYSLYQLVRYGTSPMYGKRSYMPHFTQDRMSEMQLEDLRAYIYEAAK